MLPAHPKPKGGSNGSLAWGERLVVELRLAGASTLTQANQVVADYVPRFNAQFAVEARQEGLAYRPLPQTLSASEL